MATDNEVKILLSLQDEATKKLANAEKRFLQFSGVVVTALAGVAVNANMEFTSSISELAAITGAAGEDLKFLSDKALEYGKTTTQSATEAALAFKLVASAKPDLLENREALAAVTRETITLAEAAGITLTDAAGTLGGALNQFNADAEESGRFINVLAAGAKFGSSEINDTAQALKNSGTVAKQAGLDFETTNAAIQAMAKVNLKGAEAGTGLRSVLLNLSTQTRDEFNPEIVGFTQAIKNLGDANLSTTEKEKLFGKEAIVAANALIQEADSLDILTGKLTGTNTASEQARIRVDNLAGDLKKLFSATEGAAIGFADDFNPELREAVKWATETINSTNGLKDVMPELGFAVSAVATHFVLGKISAAGFATSVLAAKAATASLLKTMIPLASAFAVFEAGRAGLEAYEAAQVSADASQKALNGSVAAFENHLVPAKERLAEIGIILDDIDPQNVDQVNAALSSLNRSSAGVREAVAAVSQELSGLGEAAPEFEKAWAETTGKAIADTKLLDEALKTVGVESMENIAEQYGKMADAFEVAVQRGDVSQEGLQGIWDKIIETSAKMGAEVSDDMLKIAEANGVVTESFQEVLDTVFAAGPSLFGYHKIVTDLRNQLNDGAISQDVFNTKVESAQAALKEASADTQDYASSSRQASDSTDEFTGSLNEETVAAESLTKALGGVSGGIKEYRNVAIAGSTTDLRAQLAAVLESSGIGAAEKQIKFWTEEALAARTSSTPQGQALQQINLDAIQQMRTELQELQAGRANILAAETGFKQFDTETPGAAEQQKVTTIDKVDLNVGLELTQEVLNRRVADAITSRRGVIWDALVSVGLEPSASRQV